MNRNELDQLLTPEGLRLLDAEAASSDVTSAVSRLRNEGHPPELVSAVVGQAQLRAKAQTKFGDFASNMLFTRAGLEQATRLEVAALHARRFRDAALTSVADLGCGIGGDALGFAALGLRVHAVDADEITAALAAYNLAPFAETATVTRGTAETTNLDDIDAVWLDPARRTKGHSETTRVRAEDYTPSLDWAFELAGRIPTGIKLGPGFDRDEIPADVEAQWISVDGSTIELVLWSGALARPGAKRAALVMRGGRAHELTAADDTPDEPVRELGAFLHEPDGAIIRARLIGEVARALDAGMTATGIAYLTGDTPKTTPFTSTFRILEQLPSDVKALARALRERDIGTLEIKKRGVDIDPAALRTKLKLKGSASGTLFVTRIKGKRATLLAERIPNPAS